MRHNRWYILALALALLLLSSLWLRRCASFEPYARSCTPYTFGNTLCVAVDLEPGVFEIDSSGAFRGRQYDLVNRLFPGETISWSPFTSRGDALRSLMSGQTSLYATSYPLTAADLPPGTLSSHEIYVSGFTLVHRRDSLAGEAVFGSDTCVRIHIPKGSPSIRMILEHVRELALSQLEIVEEDRATPTSLILDVANHKIDYTICDRELAEEITRTIPGMVCDDRISQDMYQVWLLNSRDTLLLRTLNARIDSLLAPSEHPLDTAAPSSSLQIH